MSSLIAKQSSISARVLFRKNFLLPAFDSSNRFAERPPTEYQHDREARRQGHAADHVLDGRLVAYWTQALLRSATGHSMCLKTSDTSSPKRSSFRNNQGRESVEISRRRGLRRDLGLSPSLVSKIRTDVLVLAGDIHGAVKAVEVFEDWPVPVLYVAGNHEFYSERWERVRSELRLACEGTQVRLLGNDAVHLAGVRFLGCTLWTDFRQAGMTQKDSMREVGRSLNDYVLIRTEKGKLRPYQTLADDERSRAWLEAELAKPFDGTTVVVTHHAPPTRSAFIAASLEIR